MWTYPETHTWYTGQPDSAADRNRYIKDALVDLHRRTTVVADNVGSTADNVFAGTSALTYGDLTSSVPAPSPGPAVTVEIGTTLKALVTISCYAEQTIAFSTAFMSVALSGATEMAAEDAQGLGFTAPAANTGIHFGMAYPWPAPLVPGLTTFSTKYRAHVSGTANFRFRRISVSPLGA